ncbi:hypothetical protein NUSPORA_01222 [Nucleospora cyclopteri]
MTKAYRVNSHKLTAAIAGYLETQQIEMPKNHELLKTGHGKQQSPQQKNWFYLRMASIARRAMCKDRLALKTLANRYGNRKDRGVKPHKFAQASKYVIQKAIDNFKLMGWFDFNGQESILTDEAKKILNEIIEKVEEQE